MLHVERLHVFTGFGYAGEEIAPDIEQGFSRNSASNVASHDHTDTRFARFTRGRLSVARI